MQRELERFVVRFDSGEYWAAHEELEPAWLRDRDPELEGLIHLAAAMLHAERGNRGGAGRKACSALRLLGEATTFDGLPLTPAREAAAALARACEGDSSAPSGVVPLPAARLGDGLDLPALEGRELPYRVRRYDEGYRIGRDPSLRSRR